MNEEFKRWQLEIEHWRSLGFQPRGDDRSGLWHDCAWVGRTETLMAYHPNCVVEAQRQEIARLKTEKAAMADTLEEMALRIDAAERLLATRRLSGMFGWFFYDFFLEAQRQELG
jgi:hypothetical protein